MTTPQHSCPYAIALSDADDASQKSDHDTGTSLQSLVHEAKTQCPAFSHHKAQTTSTSPLPVTNSSSTCPFSSATTASDIRQTLLQVPPSHIQQPSHSFSKALQHLHTVSGSLMATTKRSASSGAREHAETAQFVLPGGCPVQTFLPAVDKDAAVRVPFLQAMEEYSLASIMARMANELAEEGGRVDGAVEESIHVDHILRTTSTVDTDTASTTAKSASSSSLLLSQALKSGTAASHEAAENVHFVKNFIVGKIDRGLYKELLLKLYHVYESMEGLLDQCANTHFGSCHFPKELNRTAALLEDLEYWYGDNNNNNNNQTSHVMSPATRDYVNRLHHLAKTQPLLLLSHAYTRYLGDLSGGKILARVARRALHLSKKEDGLAFYEFENIASAKLFKDQYRQALDGMDLSEADIHQLVREANIAFLLNMRLFEELDVLANVKGARVRSLEEVLEFDMGADQHAPEEGAVKRKQDEKCPFVKLGSGTGAILPNPHAPIKEDSSGHKQNGGRCPWPFVFFHDPWMGMQDFQTWVVFGLALAWLWTSLQHKVEV